MKTTAGLIESAIETTGRIYSKYHFDIDLKNAMEQVCNLAMGQCTLIASEGLEQSSSTFKILFLSVASQVTLPDEVSFFEKSGPDLLRRFTCEIKNNK
jgi:hypothetical protein